MLEIAAATPPSSPRQRYLRGLGLAVAALLGAGAVLLGAMLAEWSNLAAPIAALAQVLLLLTLAIHLLRTRPRRRKAPATQLAPPSPTQVEPVLAAEPPSAPTPARPLQLPLPGLAFPAQPPVLMPVVVEEPGPTAPPPVDPRQLRFPAEWLEVPIARPNGAESVIEPADRAPRDAPDQPLPAPVGSEPVIAPTLRPVSARSRLTDTQPISLSPRPRSRPRRPSRAHRGPTGEFD